jgi:hypothetical protein
MTMIGFHHYHVSFRSDAQTLQQCVKPAFWYLCVSDTTVHLPNYLPITIHYAVILKDLPMLHLVSDVFLNQKSYIIDEFTVPDTKRYFSTLESESLSRAAKNAHLFKLPTRSPS